MWNASANTIPENNIFDEHMRILEDGVCNAAEFDVTGEPLLQALEYFEARCLRQGGLRLFRRGLKDNRIDLMAEGLALLKKHLGPG